jgi:penicillin-binding protein 1C
VKRWSLYICGFTVLGCATVFCAIVFVPLPPDLFRPAAEPTILTDHEGHQIAVLASIDARAQSRLPLGDMGNLPEVTIALEDARFYRHNGIDVYALLGAIFRNIRSGHIVSGASTISEQLIKITSNRSRRSWSSKLYESVAALRLEMIWSKDRILEEYLNRSHYGNRLIGPRAAANAYFNKSPQNLTITEAIYLASIPQAPTRFNPWRHQHEAALRYKRCVAQLKRTSSLFDVSDTPPPFARPIVMRSTAPHFVDFVRRKYRGLSGTIASTIDSRLQNLAQAELECQLGNLALRGVSQGAVVILDNTDGSVRAMVGSRGYGAHPDGQINGATIYRSSGSTLKPFLYLKGIDERAVTAATLLPDTRDAVRNSYPDYDPTNYDKSFLGPVRVREALGNSLNVPAVVMLSKLGARKVFMSLQNCGITFPRDFADYGAGLILGNADVRLLDLAAAFTVFSGNGLSVEPRFLQTDSTRHRFVASNEATAIVADILSDNDARRRTFGPFSPLAFEHGAIPCKTGTSSGFRDAWTVGTTAQHTVAVWMGNFDGKPMDEVAAITGPAPVWRALIDYLLSKGDTPVPGPIESDRLKVREICSLSGLVPVAASPTTTCEWFLSGTEPTQTASDYFRLVGGHTQIVLPPEYAAWCTSAHNVLGAFAEGGDALKIVSPRENAKFKIDTSLSAAQQAVPLTARGPAAEPIRWTVDNFTVEAQPNHDCFWRLIPGRHKVEAFSSRNHAEATFEVE